MKCDLCNKTVKENTAGDLRYCQGHWGFSKEVLKQEGII
jgi:hypothetical protein